MSQITYNNFQNIEIRVGKIITVEEFPQARKPAYKLWIDFGELGIKKSSAGLTKLYRTSRFSRQTNFSSHKPASTSSS